MGYDITGTVTITITEEQQTLLILRQTYLDEYFQGGSVNTPSYAHMGLADAIIEASGIEPYEPVTIYQKANILTIKGEPPSRLADIDDLHAVLQWVAESGAAVHAYLQGEDGERWAWTAQDGAYTLTETGYADFSTKRLAAVQNLEKLFKEHPEMWDTIPASVAELLRVALEE